MFSSPRCLFYTTHRGELLRLPAANSRLREEEEEEELIYTEKSIFTRTGPLSPPRHLRKFSEVNLVHDNNNVTIDIAV